MSYLQKLFFVALFAGGIAGVVGSVLNISIAVPMILQAEVYEHAAEHAEAGAHGDHEHPEMTSVTRNSLTVVAMVLAYVGFAFLITVAAELKGSLMSWKSGIAWGVAGYLVFSFIPAFGLPPELPGMPAADLGERQIWWIACAACTTAAIALVTTYRTLPSYILAAVLLISPFVVGAPTLVDAATLVPPALHQSFVIGTLGTGLMTWLTLGLSLGMLRSRRRNEIFSAAKV